MHCFFSGYPQVLQHGVDGLRQAAEHLCQFVQEHVQLVLHRLSEFFLVYLPPTRLFGFRPVISAVQPFLPLVECLRGDAEHLFQFVEGVSFLLVFDGLEPEIHAICHVSLSGFSFLYLS